MFEFLKRQNRNLAFLAFGLYLVEAAILAFRETVVFTLLRESEQSVLEGHPESLQNLAGLVYESQSFAYSLHTLVFATGATIFYYLFFKSDYLPRPLIVVGIIAVPLAP